MKPVTPNTPEDRLLGMLSKFESFVRHHDVNMSAYKDRVRSGSVGAVIDEFVAECEAKNVTLPMAYWGALFRLREEVSA